MSSITTGTLKPRQLWAATTTSSRTPYCTPLTLPSLGVLIINDSTVITLTKNAVFEPACTGTSSSVVHGAGKDNSTVTDFRDPFYASISPQIYALAAATVISYLLVTMLFITPRTFFVGGPGGGSGFLSRRGIMGGSYGNSATVGVGRRPWLQKFAAVMVAISLTIATVDTFRVAQRQYDAGFEDSAAMVDEVTSSLEIRIVQVISYTFLWLAQVQTLIRLFPRHKEKVVIKWLGFALILLDTLFSILNNFVYNRGHTRPRSFQDAVPALSYLFELSIGLIYASCIVYFSISKRRFAFFHPRMRNICVVAFMSMTAVLVPVVFFVLDVSKPDVAGWGDYIRWVGAAAASVVVWEWVERIEALERDERKDGILGREIFDDDEMLGGQSEEPGRSRRGGSGKGNLSTSISSTDRWRPLRSRVPFQGRTVPAAEIQPAAPPDTSDRPIVQAQLVPPPSAVTPISRADTTSAASTQYAVRYHTVSSPSPSPGQQLQHDEPPPSGGSDPSDSGLSTIDAEKAVLGVEGQSPQMWTGITQSILRAVPNPFKRRRASPPVEVASAMRDQHGDLSGGMPEPIGGRKPWNLMSKIDAFTAIPKDRHTPVLPVTVIPAQSRGQRTWSPEDFSTNAPQSGPISQTVSADVAPRSVTIIEPPIRRTNAALDVSPEHGGTGGLQPDSAGRGPDVAPSHPSISERGNQILSRRGTLTISEDQSRTGSAPRGTADGPARHSPYTRPHLQLQTTSAADRGEEAGSAEAREAGSSADATNARPAEDRSSVTSPQAEAQPSTQQEGETDRSQSRSGAPNGGPS